MFAKSDDTERPNSNHVTRSSHHVDKKRPLSSSSTSSSGSTNTSTNHSSIATKSGNKSKRLHTDSPSIMAEDMNTSENNSIDKSEALTDEDLVSAEEERVDGNGASVLSDSGEPCDQNAKVELTYIEKVVREIITTEETYVNDLEDVIQGYLEPLRDVLGASVITEEDILHLFGNIEEIYEFNRNFLTLLHQCDSEPAKIAQCFVNNSEGFKIYTQYCTNYPNGVAVLSRMMRDGEMSRLFKRCQTSVNHTMPIGSYLLKPVQRILKYHLLLQSMSKKYEQGVAGYRMLQSALSLMVQVAEHINEMKRKHERQVRVQEIESLLDGWEGDDITHLGELLLEGTFRMYGAKAHRHVFLFEKGVILAKRRQDGARGWTQRAFIECSNLMLIESIPREPLSFHIIPFDNPKIQYTLQAKTVEKKQKWCKEIKQLIIDNYSAAIPEKAKNLVMQLGHSREEDEKIMETLTEPAKRQHHAPQYLEKRLQRRKSGTDLLKRPKSAMAPENSNSKFYLERQSSVEETIKKGRSKSQPEVIISQSSDTLELDKDNDVARELESVHRVRSWGDEPSAITKQEKRLSGPILRAPSFKQAIALNRVDSSMIKDTSIRGKLQKQYSSLRRKMSSTSSTCSMEEESHAQGQGQGSRSTENDNGDPTFLNLVYSSNRRGSQSQDTRSHDSDEEYESPYCNVVIAPGKIPLDIGDYIHFDMAQEMAGVSDNHRNRSHGYQCETCNDCLCDVKPPTRTSNTACALPSPDDTISDEGDYVELRDLSILKLHLPTRPCPADKIHERSPKIKNSVSFQCDFHKQLTNHAENEVKIRRSNSIPSVSFDESKDGQDVADRYKFKIYNRYATPPRNFLTTSEMMKHSDIIIENEDVEFDQGVSVLENEAENSLELTGQYDDEVPPPLPPRSTKHLSKRPITIATTEPEAEMANGRDVVDEYRPRSLYSPVASRACGQLVPAGSSSSGVSSDGLSGSLKHMMAKITKAISPKGTSPQAGSTENGNEQSEDSKLSNKSKQKLKNKANKSEHDINEAELKLDDKPLKNSFAKPRRIGMLTKHLHLVTDLLTNNKSNIGTRIATAKPIILGENYTPERARPPRPIATNKIKVTPGDTNVGTRFISKAWSQFDIASSSDDTDDTVLSDNDSIYEDELTKVLEQNIDNEEMFRDSAIYSDLDSEQPSRQDGHSSVSPPRISIKDTVKNIEDTFTDKPVPVQLDQTRKKDLSTGIVTKLKWLEKSSQYKKQGISWSDVGAGIQERLKTLKDKAKYVKPDSPQPELKLAVSKTLRDRTMELQEHTNKPIRKQVTDLSKTLSVEDMSNVFVEPTQIGVSEV